MRRRANGLAGVSVTALVVIALSGCTTGSDPSPSTGVDELVVPTPAPVPTDFVATIDNPWFVLDDATFAAVPSVASSGEPASDPSSPLPGVEPVAVERTTAPGPDVAGVPTTSVTLDGVTDLYAQDTRGNVWWFGHDGADGDWQAGSEGAQAGLVMPAEPRRGDGFRRALVPGEDLRAEVLEVEDDTVVLATVDDGEITRTTYTRGIGLELVESDVTGAVVLARQVEGE